MDTLSFDIGIRRTFDALPDQIVWKVTPLHSEIASIAMAAIKVITNIILGTLMITIRGRSRKFSPWSVSHLSWKVDMSETHHGGQGKP